MELYAIADISCDINGGVEFTSKATTIDKPFFYYDTINMKDADKYTIHLDFKYSLLGQLGIRISK